MMAETPKYPPEEYTPEEQEKLVEFRQACTKLKLTEEQNTDAQLIRWLRARDLSIDKAFKMLKDHLKWRRDFRIDGIVEREEVPPGLVGLTRAAYLGVDKDGFPLLIVPIGSEDMVALIEEFGEERVIRVIMRNMETIVQLMKKLSKEQGREVTQFVEIMDMEGFQIKQFIMNKNVRNMNIKMQKMMDDNYPEIIRLVMGVNAPKLFSVAFKIFKPFVSKRTLEKLDIYGQDRDEWKKVIQERFPVELIPKHWGGTRKGSDEFCSQDDIWMNGPLPAGVFEGFLTSEEEEEEDSTLTATTINARATFKLTVNVLQPNSQLMCRFYCELYDIGFQILGPDHQELVPWKRIASDKELHTDHHLITIPEPGDYIVVFDNAFSIYHQKTVHYNVSVIDSELPEEATTEATSESNTKTSEVTPEIAEKTEGTPEIVVTTEATTKIAAITETTPDGSEITEATPEIAAKTEATPDIAETT